MQVFRPYVDWKKSAEVLDDKRLGKQRIECKQVLKVILRKLDLIRDGRRGWVNHPIVLMYFNDGRPYIRDLIGFFDACVKEWKRRGFNNLINLNDIENFLERVNGSDGTPITHIHEIEYRRILLIKNLKHYIKIFPHEEVLEVIKTDPVMINGVNSWIWRDFKKYEKFIKHVNYYLRKRARRLA